MTQGNRKLIVALIAMGIAAAVPLTNTQADVILGVVWAMMGVNAVEHIGGAISAKAGLRPDGRSHDSSDAARSQGQ
jgi:hypothetical protein